MAGDVSGSVQLFGRPIIAAQIDQLRKFGIGKFWIEAENRPGAILGLVDELRADGVGVEMVASPSELAQKISADEKLFVQAAGILVGEDLLSQFLAMTSPFVATVDIREENEKFERIDLNNRWAGAAIFGPETVRRIADLPSGWNIASSLLRQALQDKVVALPLRQAMIIQGSLRLISNSDDAEKFANDQLNIRSGAAFGFVESKIYRPIVGRFAPLIWSMKSGRMALDIGVILLGIACLLAAFFDFPVISASMAVLTGFVMALRFALRRVHDIWAKILGAMVWLLLASGLLIFHWRLGYGQYIALFPVFMLGGLTVYISRYPQEGWRRFLEISPGFIGWAMIFCAATGHIIAGTMLLSLIQLGLLFLFRIR